MTRISPCGARSTPRSTRGSSSKTAVQRANTRPARTRRNSGRRLRCEDSSSGSRLAGEKIAPRPKRRRRQRSTPRRSPSPPPPRREPPRPTKRVRPVSHRPAKNGPKTVQKRTSRRSNRMTRTWISATVSSSAGTTTWSWPPPPRISPRSAFASPPPPRPSSFATAPASRTPTVNTGAS